MTREINFTEWGGENFCNFIDPISMKVDPGKVTLITGPNGIGKTTLFEMLSYALYGVTSKGLKGEDVVNERTMQNCFAWADFDIAGEKYRAERYCKHKKNKNNVVLYRGGTEIKVGANEVKAEIDRIFMSYKLFMNIFFFSQKVKSFFTELPDGDQKEIFRKIIGLDDYLLYYKEGTKRSDFLLGEITKVNNNTIVAKKIIDDCVIELENLTTRRKDFYIQRQKDIVQISYVHEALQSKLKELTDVLSLFSEIQLRRDLDIINQKISEIQMRNEIVTKEYEREISDILSKKISKKAELDTEKNRREREQIEKLNNLKNSLQEKFNEFKLSSSKEISTLNGKATLLKSKIDGCCTIKPIYKKEINDITENVIGKAISTCPTCYQEISEDIKNKLKGRIKDLEGKILSLEEEINGYSQEVIETSNKKEELSEVINNHNFKLLTELGTCDLEHRKVMEEIQLKLQIALGKLEKAFEDEIEEIRKRKLAKQSEIMIPSSLLQEKEEIEKKLRDMREIEKQAHVVRSDISVQRKLLELKQKEEFDESQVASTKQKLIKLNADLAILSQELSNLQINDKRYSIIKKMFSSTGIPSMLIDESVPFINETVSNYLGQISGGRYVVSFDTMRETKAGDIRDKISINVLDTHTLASSRNKLSGGQTRIIDIATILTLANLQSVMKDVKINLLLFDEIFDSLDENNITYVSRVLKNTATDKAIFIISHVHLDAVEADEVIRLEG